MKNIESKVDDIKIDIVRIEQTIHEFIEKSENKFAAKWVENSAKFVVATVIGSIILAIVALVIKK